MNVLTLQLDGFRLLEINENGTETWMAPNSDIIKSYLSGYVRKETVRRSYHTGRVTRQIYQMNLTKKANTTWEYDGKIYSGESTVRIMLPTHNERHGRMLDWWTNVYKD